MRKHDLNYLAVGGFIAAMVLAMVIAGALLALADDRLLVLRSYAVERPSGADSVEASIVALNLAVAEIFGRFLADARRTALAVRPTAR